MYDKMYIYLYFIGFTCQILIVFCKLCQFKSILITSSVKQTTAPRCSENGPLLWFCTFTNNFYALVIILDR